MYDVNRISCSCLESSCILNLSASDLSDVQVRSALKNQAAIEGICIYYLCKHNKLYLVTFIFLILTISYLENLT